MTNRSQAQNNGKTKKISSWDDAIADVEQRLRDLQFSLRIFKESKRKGEPWPLDEKAGTDQKSVPA